MEKTDIRYQTYVQILKEELVPAMGCTEPIALAYCCARAREILGMIPEECVVEASGNIIKNVKSVVVPNTDGLKGIEAAATAGIIGGQASKVLEVIADVTAEQKEEMKRYLEEGHITVRPLESGEVLDMLVTMKAGENEARVRISGSHTNIVLEERNGEAVCGGAGAEAGNGSGGAELGAAAAPCTGGPQPADRGLLSVEAICDFVETVDIEEVREVIGRQIAYNSAIAAEGMKENYGANIGKVILQTYGDDIKIRAKAMAAAGSDARMSGCELPVIINSGSGNQGMTASLPVIEYAKELNSGEEKLYRALVMSNLITIHQKTGLGRLSAYCGAVCAGCGAGCGIAWLKGADFKAIAHTLVNSLAIVSGIICDGAKPSCAAKIASAVDAGILGYSMYLNGQQFYGGDGIVSKGVENTIHNVGRLGRDGMRETDKEIIRIMTNC